MRKKFPTHAVVESAARYLVAGVATTNRQDTVDAVLHKLRQQHCDALETVYILDESGLSCRGSATAGSILCSSYL